MGVIAFASNRFFLNRQPPPPENFLFFLKSNSLLILFRTETGMSWNGMFGRVEGQNTTFRAYGKPANNVEVNLGLD